MASDLNLQSCLRITMVHRTTQAESCSVAQLISTGKANFRVHQVGSGLAIMFRMGDVISKQSHV